MNTLETCQTTSPYNKIEECARFVITDVSKHFILSSVTEPDQEYTFSFWVRSENNADLIIGDKTIGTSSEWNKHVFTFIATMKDLHIGFCTIGNYDIYHPQLEIGNKASDYSPAPEDMASNNELNIIEQSLQSLIQQTSDGISMKVMSVADSVSSLQSTVSGNKDAADDRFKTIERDVEAKVSKEGFEVNVQQIISQTGAPSVITSKGYKFGDDGLIINELDAYGNITGGTNTKIDHEGMEVRDNEASADAKPILTANKDGVNAKNLEATTYLVVGGRSRFENYNIGGTYDFTNTEIEAGTLGNTGQNNNDETYKANNIRTVSFLPLNITNVPIITSVEDGYNLKFFFYDETKTYISSATARPPATTTIPENAKYMRYRIQNTNGISVEDINKVTIEQQGEVNKRTGCFWIGG